MVAATARKKLLAGGAGLVRMTTGCAVAPWTEATAPAAPNPIGAGPYEVVRVVDGDTVAIAQGRKVLTIRLIGVDTPEVKKPHSTVECFGPEASAFATRELLGRPVWIERDPVSGRRDRYGRELGYVRTVGGELFNERLIAEGFAREYTYQRQEYKYRHDFQRAQRAAQATKAGLWGACR